MEGLFKFGLWIAGVALVLILLCMDYPGQAMYLQVAEPIASPLLDGEMIFASGTNLDGYLLKRHKIKNVSAQTLAMDLYTKLLIKNIKNPKQDQLYAVNNFIVYGTMATTNWRAVERYNLVKSYVVRQHHLPNSSVDWQRLLAGDGVLPNTP